MFRIKICGVTRTEDALAVADAGADAIGLNFYEKSPRYAAPELAKEIVAALDGRLLTVGVFVNRAAEEITAIAEQVGLDAIQLHGDEPDDFALGLPSISPVIRAFRMDMLGLGPIAERTEAARQAGRAYNAVLVDAAVKPAPGEEVAYGGTGHTVDWESVRSGRGGLGGTPLILAGGLKPTNVAKAARVTGADGVDTASGVESSPGVKDASLIRSFVENALSGLGIGR